VWQVKLSQRIAIFLFCCLVGSATHSLFAQTAGEGLRGAVTGAAKSATQIPGSSTLTAEPAAGFSPPQSLDSSTSQVVLWSIRHDLAQNLHSLRSSAGQEAVPEDQLQVLAPTTKK
jgi:hypothetical protein